ncbi:MAG: hypothetical protein ACTIH2_08460 [Anaerococcus sp.]
MNNDNVKKIPLPLLIVQIILGVLAAYFVFKSGNIELRLVFVSLFFLMSGFISYKYLKNISQGILGLTMFIVNLILYFI